MHRLSIFRSSTGTPQSLVSSGLHPATTMRGVNARTDELLTTVVAASMTTVSLDRTASARTLSTRSRRSLWARVEPALSVEGIAASYGPPGKPLDRAAIADPVADPVADRLVDLVADPPPAPAASRPSSETARVELTIDSLRNYEIIKPIPVFVESLGDRHYVAEVPDLNITTSASNLSEILIVLKDNVTQTYDRLRIRKSLDAEQTKQLRLLETYIGKSRRSWLDRR